MQKLNNLASYLWLRVSQAGVSEDLSLSDARYVIVTNRAAIISFAVLITVGIKNVLMGHPALLVLGIIEIAAGGFVLFAPLINRRHHYLFATTWVVVALILPCGSAGFLVGKAIGIYLVLPLLVIFPFLLFPKQYSFLALLVAIAVSILYLITIILAPDGPSIGAPYEEGVVSKGLINAGIVLCIGLIAVGIISRQATQSAENLAEQEHQRAESLLLNVLPGSIADRLKRSDQIIADGVADATVLFADIVGFTSLSQAMTPGKLVIFLDTLFSAFDEIAERLGLEKIKTIGDAYMIAGGVPLPCPDHAARVAKMALEMLEVVKKTNLEGSELEVRIGIHSGDLVAGVIGRRKFAYDLWGDTVNTASRMESHGQPGRIQVTESVYQALHNDFNFEERGSIQVKGKGNVSVWYLIGQKQSLMQPDANVTS